MDVAKIAFTGSTEIGKQMLIYAGQSNMKRVSLECGGKTPQIFLADLPDLDAAVTYAINGIFGNMGEVCNAGSRLLIDRPIAERIPDALHRTRQDRVSGRRPARSGDQSRAAGHRLAPHAGAWATSTRGKSEGAKLEFGGNAPGSAGQLTSIRRCSRASTTA